MSEEAQDLITKLCEVNPAKRLGNLSGGVKDVQSHAFFKEIDWEKLYRREIQAPIIPQIKSHVSRRSRTPLLSWIRPLTCLVTQDDTRNFEDYDLEPERKTVYTPDLRKKYDGMFGSF